MPKINNNEIIIPIKKKNLKEKRIDIIVNRIKTILNKDKVCNVVLSKKIQQNRILLNEILKKDINIFNGKWLYVYLLPEIIDYIVKKSNINKKISNISFVVNCPSAEIIENIKLISNEFKLVNIITNNIKRFEKLKEEIYNESGIIVTISNNKKKSLSKSEIIVNFDFNEEDLNKYNLYENAVVINFVENIKVNKKRFNGICINNYEINAKRLKEIYSVEFLDNYYLRDLFEAEFFRKDLFYNIRKDIATNNVKIKELYTINGIL